MSILDVAAGPAQRKQSGPVKFSALRDPVFDEVTGRTYQLVQRESDSAPYALSCAGNVANALAVENQRRALQHSRGQLDEDKTLTKAERASVSAEIAVSIKALLVTRCVATRDVTRMLQVYSERGID